MLSDPSNEGAPAREIRDRVGRILKRQNQEHLLPGLVWTHKFKASWKESNRERPWQDRPWNLGSTTVSGPSEPRFAVRELLELSVLCSSLGTSFTRRQAGWAAKLLPAVPDGLSERPIVKLDWLRFWSAVYSLEELQSEMDGVTPVDTSQLDFILATDPLAQTLPGTASVRSLTVRLAEQADRVSAPASWAVAVEAYLYENNGLKDHPVQMSVESKERGWIRYFIGEAERSLGRELSLAHWRTVAAVLEASPLIGAHHIESDHLGEAEAFARKIVDQVLDYRESELLGTARIRRIEGSHIYAHNEI